MTSVKIDIQKNENIINYILMKSVHQYPHQQQHQQEVKGATDVVDRELFPPQQGVKGELFPEPHQQGVKGELFPPQQGVKGELFPPDIIKNLDNPFILTNLLATLTVRNVILNRQYDNILPPLHFAAFTGKVDAVKILLRWGADPNFICDNPRVSPLMLACSQGSKDKICLRYSKIAQLLINAGAHINIHGAEGFTPLLFAVDDGDLGIVRLLIENGADVNLSNKAEYNDMFQFAGFSPLSHAYYRDHIDIIEYLVKHGAKLRSHIRL